MRATPGENYVRMLTALARAVNAHRVLEIGAGPDAVSGEAFVHALSGQRGAELWSIDIDSGRPSARQMEAAQDLGVAWRAVWGDSLRVVLPREWLIPGVAFDLLYIDGDHGGEHALGDFRRFAPLVRDGGLVIWDDYPTRPGVRQGVHEAVAQIERESLRGLTLIYNHEDGNAHYVVQIPGRPA